MSIDFVEQIRQFIEEIINESKSRFHDIDNIQSFSIFDVNTLKKNLNNDNLNSYGVEEINNILKKFNQGLLDENGRVEFMFNEWMDLEYLFIDNYLKQYDPFSSCIDSYKNTYPNICKFYLLSKTLPVSTSICEVGFSIQDVIKTYHRSLVTDF